MLQSGAPTSGQSEIELPGVTHPVLMVLVVLPMALILLIAGALIAGQPPALMGLLGIVGCCCVMLSVQALQSMLAGKVTVDADGMTVSRFLSETTYPWSAVEFCKVMNATGTFGDDPLIDVDDRAGVGLFLRGLKRTRGHALDADVILCAGSKSHLQPLMQVAAKIEAAVKWSQMPQRRAPSRPATTRAPTRPGSHGGLRGRQQPSAAAKVDPVAKFRAGKGSSR